MHLVVVDPGVGSARRAIAVRAADCWFVGPDNGVLSWALARWEIQAIRQLETVEFFLQPVSRTFPGRDVFAPVAAHLRLGLSSARLGRELNDFVRLPWPKPSIRAAAGRSPPGSAQRGSQGNQDSRGRKSETRVSRSQSSRSSALRRAGTCTDATT